MIISVVICTYNRCADLRRTLETFCGLIIPEGLRWELLVVDNNSTDATKEVCAEFAKFLPLRYFFELRQGKSCALNRAVSETAGDLVLFTDDDVDVTPEWISSLADATQRYPDAMFFGGKVLSSWQGQPPHWFVENADWLRSNPCVDWGGQEFLIHDLSKHIFIGANIAFRRAVFAWGIRYREDIGPQGDFNQGNARHGAEEFGPQEAVVKKGLPGLYVPTAVIHHRDPLHRMTEKYLRYYYRHMGEMTALTGKTPSSPHQWLGAPRYLWRKVVFNAIKYLCTRCFAPSRIWLKAETEAATAFGEICGCRCLRRISHNAGEVK